jgi:hypothetical protein
MTYDEARAAIEGLVAAGWTATPVAYPNVTSVAPADGGAWAELSIAYEPSVLASFGGTPKRYRCHGSAIFRIRVPSGTGAAAAYQMAGSAVALFNGAAITGLTFGAATASPDTAGESATFSVAVVVPFWHDDFR